MLREAPCEALSNSLAMSHLRRWFGFVVSAVFETTTLQYTVEVKKIKVTFLVWPEVGTGTFLHKFLPQ